MKTLRKTITTYARKRARTMAVAVVKKIGRSVKRRVMKRASNTRAARAFNSLTGGTRLTSDNASRRYASLVSLTSNSLNLLEMTNIGQGTGPNERENNSILLKGMAINFMFVNTRPLEKLYLNFAMLTPKQGNLIDNTSFFRSNDVNINEDFASSPDILSALTKHIRPINADKYIIHFHKRCILGPRGGTTTAIHDLNSPSTKKYKIYYKLNQKVTFSGTPEQADQKIWIVYWFNVLGSTPPIASTTAMNVDYDVNVVFKGE